MKNKNNIFGSKVGFLTNSPEGRIPALFAGQSSLLFHEVHQLEFHWKQDMIQLILTGVHCIRYLAPATVYPLQMASFLPPRPPGGLFGEVEGRTGGLAPCPRAGGGGW